MHHLVNKAIRYFQVFWLFARINYLEGMEYRANFIASMLGPMLYGGSYILVLHTIISKVPQIAGWSFDQLLALFSFSQLIYFVSWLLYRPSLGNLPSLVRSGMFDTIAKLPINTKFVASFKFQSTSAIIPVVIWLAVFVFSLRSLSINLVGIFLFLFFAICAVTILYNITFLAASVCFWIIEADDLIGLIEDVRDFSAYPLKVFPTAAQFALLFIIPTLLIVYVPVTSIMNILDWHLGIISIAMVAITYFISEKVWQIGLRRYSSASS